MSTLRERALQAHQTAQDAAQQARTLHDAAVRQRALDDLKRAVVYNAWLIPVPAEATVVTEGYERPYLLVDGLRFITKNGQGVWLLETCQRCGEMLEDAKVESLRELGSTLAADPSASMAYHLHEWCDVTVAEREAEYQQKQQEAERATLAAQGRPFYDRLVASVRASMTTRQITPALDVADVLYAAIVDAMNHTPTNE